MQALAAFLDELARGGPGSLARPGGAPPLLPQHLVERARLLLQLRAAPVEARLRRSVRLALRAVARRGGAAELDRAERLLHELFPRLPVRQLRRHVERVEALRRALRPRLPDEVAALACAHADAECA